MNTQTSITQKTVPPLSAWQYALNIFLSLIPLVGFILLLVWAFSSGENIHRKNWAKGRLIIMVIGYVFVFLFFFLIVGLGSIAAILSEYQ